nr:DUF3780 domain-containing protein [Methanococcus maripaludis]
MGFGFIPDEAKHHFLVVIPTSKSKNVLIYERFKWDSGNQVSDIGINSLKAELKYEKWKSIESALSSELNYRLKREDLLVGKFKQGQNPVERLLGKEMMLLVWAIENEEIHKIEIAIKNWLGLSPEERWWLFTMTNAVTGSYDDKNRGWRVALRYALCDNPIDETRGYRQGRIAEELYKKI